jgi:hypothetical protein
MALNPRSHAAVLTGMASTAGSGCLFCKLMVVPLLSLKS